MFFVFIYNDNFFIFYLKKFKFIDYYIVNNIKNNINFYSFLIIKFHDYFIYNLFVWKILYYKLFLEIYSALNFIIYLKQKCMQILSS